MLHQAGISKLSLISSCLPMFLVKALCCSMEEVSAEHKHSIQVTPSLAMYADSIPLWGKAGWLPAVCRLPTLLL